MDKKIILIVLFLLGWLIIYVAEFLKAHQESFIRAHYMTVGIIRLLGVFMGFFLLFSFAFIAQPRIEGVFGIVSIVLGMCFIGTALYIVARFLVEWWDKLTALAESKYLLATGVYGKSRHPTYLAGFFLLWGWFFAWRAVYGLVLMPIILVAFLIEIFLEEKTLSIRFGDEHIRYCREVPMFLPVPLFIGMISLLAIIVISIIFGLIQIV